MSSPRPLTGIYIEYLTSFHLAIICPSMFERGCNALEVFSKYEVFHFYFPCENVRYLQQAKQMTPPPLKCEC